jgi:polyisoprenoid-binding protein YceI
MTTATQTKIPAGTYGIDTVHSSAAFEVTHNEISTFRGTFGDVDASLESSDDGIKLTGAVKVDSIDVDYEDLRAHLLSPEFFDAERHPEVRFASTELETADDGAVELRGELSINTITKPIEARGELKGPVVGPDNKDHIALDFETVVDRHDFGMGWNMDLPDGRKVLGDDVKLIVHLELIRR